MRKAIVGTTFIFLFACLSACSNKASSPPTLRIMAPQAPTTLNPRATLDASGQWLSALLFRAVTRLDADLAPQPDLAESWSANPRGDLWVFQIGQHVDHAGSPITAQTLAECLESYRSGVPKSPLRELLPRYWAHMRALEGNRLEIQLTQPDPYLPKTLAAFRYFRSATPDGAGAPCAEPKAGQPLVGNGNYKADPWDLTPKNELRLVSLRAEFPDLLFTFVQDDNTRILKMMRGEVDAVLNGISISKTRWLERRNPDRFAVIQRPSARVSYLAFNLRDPVLSKPEVRRAIAHAIDRSAIVESRFGDLGEVAGSILSPLLSESKNADFSHDPMEAARLLDLAGYPKNETGLRFRISYKTTPIREGLETGLIISEMLRRVGIEVDLEIVEPAVFFASIRQGAFQLFSSRWLGITDGSILFRTLKTAHPANRFGYSSAETDRLLDLAAVEMDSEKRKTLYGLVQDKIAADLPFFPLWYWHNALILKKGIARPDSKRLSLNGTFDIFSELNFSEAL